MFLEVQEAETAGTPEEASAVTGINTGHRGQFPAYLQESAGFYCACDSRLHAQEHLWSHTEAGPAHTARLV